MKYKCIIFDLDGTLLDSLQGILDAINLSFKQFGYNIHRTYEEGKHCIGAGAIVFAQRAIAGTNIPLDMQLPIMNSFLDNYAKTQDEVTKPFEGINKMLKNLENAGYLLTVCSNKPYMLLKPIVKKLFPEINFKVAMGPMEGVPEKPDPFMIFKIMEKLNVKDSECLYVGDSEYDYLTAHNAGLDCVICKYGYGFYDKDFVKKANYIVESVGELESLLLNQKNA